jgi:hypothetical protein
MRTILFVAFAAAFLLSDAAVAQQATQPVTGELLKQGFEVKAVINNNYLILQKGDKAYWCGSTDPGLTWLNWPQLTREASCLPLNK